MDYNSYIGLPYQSNGRTRNGVDCWGLVRIFYSEQLGIELPDYSELYSGAWDQQLSEVINQHLDGWTATQDAQPGDVCLFNIYGEPAHVGVYCGDRRFLHARDGRDSVVESLDSTQWSRRFAGFYRYNAQAQPVPATGLPHPLRTQVELDWMPAGTTVQDFADYVNNKYRVSERLASKLVVLVDGVPVPRDQWSTTVLQENQKIAYKSVAEGRSATRLLLTFAVVVASVYFGPQAGAALAGTGASATTVAAYTAAAQMAINMAGMALINAIAPIRMPGQNDPGQARGLNLFTGASNQANRFGAIPVVLGRLRVTGTLGATPYVDTLTDTSLLNLLIVWGFGPLEITDICVGTNPISNYYNQPLTKAELEQIDLDYEKKGVVQQTPEFAQDIPRPVTLQGLDNESPAQVAAFNKLYPRDVEQQQVGVELVNNAQDGNPWQEVVLQQTNTTDIDVALSFPVGMRQIVVSGRDAGQVREATAGVEIQVRKYDPVLGWPAWSQIPSYTLNQTGTAGSPAYSDSLTPVSYNKLVVGTGDNGTEIVNVPLYQWYTYALSSSGEVRRFDGVPTESQNSDPTQELLTALQSSQYASLIGAANTASRLPQVPVAGYVKLHTVCAYAGTVVSTINHVSGYVGVSGLVLTTEEQTSTDPEGNSSTVATTINISAGILNQAALGQPAPGEPETVFTARSIPQTTQPTNSVWGSFLNNNAVWKGTQTEFVETYTATFNYSGYYRVEAAADDEGAVYIDNRLVVGMPRPGFRESVSNIVYLEAGTYPVKVTARNSGGGAAGVACVITYTENGGLNNLPTASTVLQFGTPGFYYKRRDAFNFVYKLKNREPGRYEVRVRRTNDDEKEPAEDLRNYNTVALLSVSGYYNEWALDSQGNPIIDYTQGPLNPLPQGNLARTAIRIQSTSKANGNIDGVNALVHSMVWDYDHIADGWAFRATSNPASLFLHVLTHPANAYRIPISEVAEKVDLAQLKSWHTFCRLNGYEYNAVVTQTQSVLDTLRDICAVGLASPAFVDGRWTVVIDRPRTVVTQHFTPHNSWGFESTKLLPRLPDAFRVTFPNRERAYQADEVIVYNYGKNSTNAVVFEELSLPGVTSELQAKKLARWHLAQLKLRPELYTLNVDFEYLVCNRGDLVRVNHDVPLWGTGSGRLKTVAPTTLTLTEPVYLETGVVYQIRIRTNTGGSILRTIAPVTNGWYSTVNITVALATPDGVEADNLFMIGEVSKESQELIVLSVEPSSNVTARLTLADYSPEIYSVDLTDENLQLPAFNPNITGRSAEVLDNAILQAPEITGIASTTEFAQEISSGVYENSAVVSFADFSGLTNQAQLIQLQVVEGRSDFSDSNLDNLYEAKRSTGSISIRGLRTGSAYKLRARYTNITGSVSGPWSRIYYFVNQGKTNNYFKAPTLVVDLEETYIVAEVPREYTVGGEFSTLQNPQDFKLFEYRLYKDTGTEDFWDLEPDEQNNIKVIRSVNAARFNLLDLPLPRISEAGITYRIACRAVDNNNNYSSESIFGAIVVTTIT